MQEAMIDESSDGKFLFIPYDKRWEHLRPTILRLYIEEGERMKALVERMKTEYSFSAQPSQYRYQLKKWGVKKRTTAEEKEDIVSVLGKRKQPSISTSDITLTNSDGDLRKKIDKRQLSRYLRDQMRQNQGIAILPGVFLPWNLPYNAVIGTSSNRSDHLSPLGSGPATPANLTVNSPGAATSPSGTGNDPSPTTQLVQRKVLLDRSNLFLSGRHVDLLKQVGPTDRRPIVTYLNDFWIHSFMVTKYWGKGPQQWDAAMVSFKTMGSPDVLPSPAAGDRSVASPSDLDRAQYQHIAPPSQLCRWSMHVITPNYTQIPDNSPRVSHDEPYDIEDDMTWQAWPDDPERPRLQEAMAATLVSGSFTKISPQELPMSASVIVQAAQSSPAQLEADAFAFVIMAGNLEKLGEIFDETDGDGPELGHTVQPFHLAASFMDASRSCCQMLSKLIDNLHGQSSIGVGNVDKNGLTVLDILMVNILRSHSGVAPNQVGDSFRGERRFPGEERDICGRWDADSQCVRRLLASGEERVPSGWKHPFCHTSVQGICHSITAIFGPPWGPDINSRSGLFSHRCHACASSLTLTPLHSLVLVAFHLAQDGRPGETLFGALACLIALISHGADPTLQADVSVQALVDSSDCQECDHKSMNPENLAEELLKFRTPWPSSCQLGWRVFVKTLRHAISRLHESSDGLGVGDYDDENITNIEANDVEDPMEIDTDDDSEASSLQSCRCYEFFPPPQGPSRRCTGRVIGTMWATIQAEFLTYRRISEDDSWISSNFDMRAIEIWLDGVTKELQMPLLEQNLLNNFTSCGWFCGPSDPFCPVPEEVCARYFTNMEDWRRTAFLNHDVWRHSNWME